MEREGIVCVFVCVFVCVCVCVCELFLHLCSSVRGCARSAPLLPVTELSL